MVDSRRDVAGQAGRSPSPSVQATMIGLMAILLWSLMTGLVRVVADAFGATLGSALIYTCGAVLLLVFRRPAPLRKYPRTYLIVGGLLFVFYESSISLSIGLASSAASSVEVSLVNYLWPTMMVLLAAAFVPSGEKRSARNEGIGREPAAPSDAQAQDDSVQCGTNCSAGKPPRHSRGRAVLRVLPGAVVATAGVILAGATTAAWTGRSPQGMSRRIHCRICWHLRARSHGRCMRCSRPRCPRDSTVRPYSSPLWPWRCGSSTSLPAKVGRLPRRQFGATWLWWRPRRSSLADTPAGAMESCTAA